VIRQAEMVITDSFHGTVFSLIYEKKFVVLPREDVNSRVHSILNLVGLKNRFYDINIINEKIDYKRVKSVLDSWQEVSLRFLEDNII
jgi:hypothetical protein